MVTDWIIAALFLLIVFLLLVDYGYFYQGRHRGEYRPKPEWKPRPKIGKIYITIQPSTGLLNLPPLINGAPGVPPPAPTWDFTDDGGWRFNGRFGGFGDSTFDRTDPTPVRPFLPDGAVDDQWLKDEGFFNIGRIEEFK